MSKKVALVTGASSGIGKSIAEELVRQGIRVYAGARSLPDCFQDTGSAAASAGSPMTVCLDVNDEFSCQKVLNNIVKAEGKLDFLVQSAGFGIAGAVEDMTKAEARSQMETNFFGTITLLPAVMKQMRSQHSGLIVNIGSVAGFLPVPFQAYYSASKAAVAALTSAMANELRPFGVKCLLIQPGDTKTGFTSARIMAANALTSDYGGRCRKSIERMAHDEQNGMSTGATARVVVKAMLKRRPPQVLTIGLMYKLFAFAERILPTRLVNFVIYKLYADGSAD